MGPHQAAVFIVPQGTVARNVTSTESSRTSGTARFHFNPNVVPLGLIVVTGSQVLVHSMPWS